MGLQKEKESESDTGKIVFYDEPLDFSGMQPGPGYHTRGSRRGNPRTMHRRTGPDARLTQEMIEAQNAWLRRDLENGL